MVKYTLKQLKPGMKNIDIEVTIDFVGEKRKTGGFNNDLFLPAFVKDETGEMKMTFWAEDVKKAKPGKKLKVTKGYVTEYKGTPQLNISQGTEIVWL